MQTRLKQLRETPRPGWPSGYTLEYVAEALNAYFAEHGEERSVDASQVSKLERGDRKINEDWLGAFSSFYGVDVRELFPENVSGSSRTAPLVGYVGAGEMYYPDPASGAWVGFDHVEAPPGAVGVVAVRVKGDSMAPVYRDGDLLFFKEGDCPEIDRCVGKDCIVQIRNGPAYAKRVERTHRGALRLVSYGDLEPIDSPDVEWATPIKWVMRGD